MAEIQGTTAEESSSNAHSNDTITSINVKKIDYVDLRSKKTIFYRFLNGQKDKHVQWTLPYGRKIFQMFLYMPTKYFRFKMRCQNRNPYSERIRGATRNTSSIESGIPSNSHAFFSKMTDLAKENDAMRKQLNSLCNENLNIKNENEYIKKKVKAMLHLAQAHMKKADKLNITVQQLNCDIKNLRHENELLKTDFVTIDTHNKKLNARIKNMTGALVKNLESVDSMANDVSFCISPGADAVVVQNTEKPSQDPTLTFHEAISVKAQGMEDLTQNIYSNIQKNKKPKHSRMTEAQRLTAGYRAHRKSIHATELPKPN